MKSAILALRPKQKVTQDSSSTVDVSAEMPSERAAKKPKKLQKKRKVRKQSVEHPDPSTTTTAHDVSETPEHLDTGITTAVDSVNEIPEHLDIGIALSVDGVFSTQEANREPFHLDVNALLRRTYRKVNHDDEQIIYHHFNAALMSAYHCAVYGRRARYSSGIFTISVIINMERDVEETVVARELAASELLTRAIIRQFLFRAGRQDTGEIWSDFVCPRFNVLIALYPGF